jgi:hypothetical protein
MEDEEEVDDKCCQTSDSIDQLCGLILSIIDKEVDQMYHSAQALWDWIIVLAKNYPWKQERHEIGSKYHYQTKANQDLKKKMLS